ncbi:DUF4268 domain-containing protein [Synechococcus elongatus]|uniref:DUF4268 domain-containing protein n=1 Tax=Synechococcus elongatus TaxID=32046 RepID=UPI0030D10B09
MFGTLYKVELREIWPHEASDFTPWLAENINELGQALELELELVEQEASVGDFSLDIFAKDLGSSKSVIIENQLTKTDHDHLGKLLTYASGLDASIVIWVSESIREEHRQALEWLNQRTDNETSFFGVVIEVIKIDDSKPVFNFRVVVSPNEWQKTIRHTPPKSGINSIKGERYRSYFQNLIDELRETYRFTAAKDGKAQSSYIFSSGVTGITYGVIFAQNGRTRVELYIGTREQDKNKLIFDRLYELREEIEGLLGGEIAWERLDNKIASRIAIYTDGTIDDSDADLEVLKAWHIEKLLKIKAALGNKILPLVKATINS